MTAGQARYREWLDTKSSHQMSFGDWLRAGPADDEETDCYDCQGTGIGNPHSGGRCPVCRGTGEHRSEA